VMPSSRETMLIFIGRVEQQYPKPDIPGVGAPPARRVGAA
jgi:hypothetical protein